MSYAPRRVLPVGLLVTVSLLYGWVGLATDGRDQFLGLAGAIAMLAALAVARWSTLAAAALLIAGALPLPIATWWSIVTPVLALLALLLGWPAIRSVPRADYLSRARPWASWGRSA